MKPTAPPHPTDDRPWATYLIVAGCSLFFCSKGIFAKSAYALGATPIEILTLRMALSLPVFAVVAWVTSRGQAALGARCWLQLAGLGFIGYYFSSLVNFTGLQHITVGLERIVLFTYPGLVLLGSVLFRRQRLEPGIVRGMVASYAGIVIAFGGEAGGRQGGITPVLLGVSLVFLSALSYAFFISAGSGLVRRLGGLRFTSLVVGMSCLFIVAHYLAGHRAGDLFALPPEVWMHGGFLAVFGTVIPSFLLGVGLRRAGPQKFAVIGIIGPVGTFMLGWALLGEVPNAGQAAGFALALGGGLAVTLSRPAGGPRGGSPGRRSP